MVNLQFYQKHIVKKRGRRHERSSLNPAAPSSKRASAAVSSIIEHQWSILTTRRKRICLFKSLREQAHPEGRTLSNPGRTPANPGRSPANSGRTPANPGRAPENPGWTPANRCMSPANPRMTHQQRYQVQVWGWYQSNAYEMIRYGTCARAVPGARLGLVPLQERYQVQG